MNKEVFQSSKSEHARTPLSVRLGMKAHVALAPMIRNISLEGDAHLSEIPRDTPVVIASSHASGNYIPLALSELGTYRDIAVTDQSSHHELTGGLSGLKDLGTFINIRILGKKNFIPIPFDWVDGHKEPSMFNPGSVQLMSAAMEKGKDVLIAAETPSDRSNTGETRKTPPKVGSIAAYLALTQSAPILPVAINMTPTDNPTKFDAVVSVGEVFSLDTAQDVHRILELTEKRKSGERLSKEEVAILTAQLKTLRRAGKTVLDHVMLLEKETPERPPVVDQKNVERRKKLSSFSIKSLFGRS